MKKKKMSGNYLDFVPSYGKACNFEVSGQGEVTILVENKGVFHRLAQMLLHKPRISKIHLDRFGNFVWGLIDGKRSIYEIAEAVKQEFGEEAEPLYPRLVQYFKTLHSYGFVEIKESE